jgi:alanine-synthesizing transaminase
MTYDSIQPAQRTERIKYAVRDIVLVAQKAKAAGKTLIYLNIGDPNQFDFQTPAHVVEAIYQALKDNHNSYAPSEGIPQALEAIRNEAIQQGFQNIQDIFIGSGASECIETAISSLANEGDNILTPSPGYPLYTAVLGKLGCPENPYYLDENNGWQPDLEDIASKINTRTRAIVLINPNNPTGSVCERKTLEGILELAARHRLVILADEIYSKLILSGATHLSIAALTGEVPILTFNGLSKAYLGPGLRIGWCIMSGPQAVLNPYKEAIHKYLRARLCANHPIQYAIRPALEGDQSHLQELRRKLTLRRDITVNMLNSIDRVSCVTPAAAFYAFPQLSVDEPDETFIPRLIEDTGVVVVPGSGFGQRPATSHFRVVFLPPEDLLKQAYGSIRNFIALHK